MCGTFLHIMQKCSAHNIRIRHLCAATDLETKICDTGHKFLSKMAQNRRIFYLDVNWMYKLPVRCSVSPDMIVIKLQTTVWGYGTVS